MNDDESNDRHQDPGEDEMRAAYDREIDVQDLDEAQRDLDVDELEQLAKRASDADGAGTDEDEGATWRPKDLTAALAGEQICKTPTVLLRNDGVGLAYEGNINGVHADSGIGKSMLMIFAALTQMLDGRHVFWIDCEDSNEGLVIERLRAMGCPDRVIADRFHYVCPNEPASMIYVARLVDQASSYGACHVYIDSTGESLGLQGLDENVDIQVDLWKRILPLPFERAGHTVWLIDHSTKAADNPLYPSGSKRKRALFTGSAWLIESVVPFSRTHPGKLKLICAKDRHGTYRRGEIGAWVHVDPTGDHLQVVIEAPADSDETGAADVPVILVMRRIVAVLKDAGVDGLSVRQLRAQVRTKAKAGQQTIDDAITHAETLGCLAIAKGDRNAKVHRFVRDVTDDDIKKVTR